jgi:D-serine deaminase-like pyridoxal phosphate-dependent protein
LTAFDAIGLSLSSLDTPAYCVDLTIMEANLRSMAEWMRTRGKHWRPHIKCHKIPEIARRQVAAGALGVTGAKVSEAEVFASAGISDILIANLVVGETKLSRLVELRRKCDVIATVDHFVQAEALSEAMAAAGLVCRTIIEVNIGMDRTGIRPGADFRDLVRGIRDLPGIRLCGLMGYEGHLLRVPEEELKRESISKAMAVLGECRELMEREDVPVEIVSAGGTGSYQYTADCPEVTEIQAGGGIFGDPEYQQSCGTVGLESALFVVATVVSRPKLERAVLDSGRKTINPDPRLPTVPKNVSGRPLVDAVVKGLSAEHLTMELGPQSQFLHIGDKVRVVPGYADFTTPLHDVLYGIRDGVVETVWPIAARGKLQ